MKAFLIKNKFNIIAGLGVVGVGSVAATGIALSSSSSGEEDITDIEQEADLEVESVKPALTVHRNPYSSQNLATTGTKLIDKGYKPHHQGFHLATIDLKWDDTLVKSYPAASIGYELRQQNVRLLSEKTPDKAWQDMAEFVLENHADKENSDLSIYSPEFITVMLGMKNHWNEKEQKIAEWGSNLKAVCTATYRKGYDKNKSLDDRTLKVLKSVAHLCTTPSWPESAE